MLKPPDMFPPCRKNMHRVIGVKLVLYLATDPSVYRFLEGGGAVLSEAGQFQGLPEAILG